MRGGWIALVLGGSWWLAACATPPEFRASWYWVDEDPGNAGIRIAVLNQSAEPQNVRCIVLNRSDADHSAHVSPQFADPSASQPGNGQLPYAGLQPGQLLVVSASTFRAHVGTKDDCAGGIAIPPSTSASAAADGAARGATGERTRLKFSEGCEIPVSLAIVRWNKEPVRLDGVGAMPSALPRVWNNGCPDKPDQPANSQPADPSASGPVKPKPVADTGVEK